ncbi:MAG: hypothetical protein ACF8Q5_04025 [Phycisphaerales bacterium JB040]
MPRLARTTTLTGLALLLLPALASPPAPAQPAGAGKEATTEPTPESRAKAVEVLNRFIEAIGGRETLKNAGSVRMVAEVSMPGMGMSGTMDIKLVPGHGMVQTMVLRNAGAPADAPPVVESVTGSDGRHGYTFSGIAGVELMDESMHTQIMRDADPASVIRFQQTYPTLEYLDRREFNGKTVDAIRLVDTGGLESVQFYDVETGLMIGGSTEQETPMGKMQIATTLSDYKVFNGVKTATSTEMAMGPMTMTMTMTTVEFGTLEPGDLEHPPAAVKLLEKAAEQDKAKDAEAMEGGGEG